MSVKVTQKWSGLAAQNQAGVRSYTEVYQVSGVDTPIAAEQSRDETTGLAVPLVNQPHPYSTTQNPLKVSSLSVSCIGWQYYEVTASYSRPESGSQHPDEQNPLNKLPEIQWSQTLIGEPVEFDVEGAAIVNGLGDAFDPPLDENRVVMSCTITQNEPFYNLEKALRYVNTVNINDWNPAVVRVLGTIKGGTMRCTSIAPSGTYAPDAPYLPIVYSFEIDPLGWERRLLNQGHTGRDGSGRLYQLCHDDGTLISTDVRLKEDGTPYESSLRLHISMMDPRQMPYPAPTAPILKGTAVLEKTDFATWMKYRTKRKIDWSNIGL